MALHSSTYDLHGNTVRVSWDDATTGAAIERAFQYFGHTARPTTAEAVLRLSFERVAHPVPLPPEAREVASFDGRILAHRHEEWLYLGDGISLVRLHPGAGTAEAHVVALPDEGDAPAQLVLVGMIVLSLFVLLRHRGYFPLHGAALAHGAAGLMLVADSDSGKSTLSYALVRSGWQYLSDDSILLQVTPQGVDALTFRRHFGLDPEAGRFFPELRDLVHRRYVDEDKWCVAVEDLYPQQLVERCRPEVLVFPEIARQEESTFVPVSRSEAMRRVLHQSALVTLEPEIAPRHLDMVRRLVHQAPAFRFLGGRDVVEHPERVAAQFETLLAEAVPGDDRP